MTDPIALIISLTGCDEQTARDAFNKTEDTVDAVDLIMGPVPESYKLYAPKKRRRSMTTDEEYIDGLRSLMKEMDYNIEQTITQSNQPAASESVVTTNPHEETAQQSNCEQECQLPSLE